MATEIDVSEKLNILTLGSFRGPGPHGATWKANKGKVMIVVAIGVSPKVDGSLVNIEDSLNDADWFHRKDVDGVFALLAEWHEGCAVDDDLNQRTGELLNRWKQKQDAIANARAESEAS